MTPKNRIVVDARGWNSALYGNINSKGMALDLNNDTDISGKTSFAIAGTWQFSKRDQLRLDYAQFNHNGNMNRAVTFDSLLYNTASNLKVNTSFFDAGLSRLLDESEHGFWKLLYGVKFSKVYMQISQPTVKGTQSGEVNSNLGVPYLGIEGETNLSGNVKLNGSLKYFTLNGGGASGRLTDFGVSLLFGRDYAKNPAETEWYGTLGYRYFLLHGEDNNDSAEVRYSGPIFGVEGRF